MDFGVCVVTKVGRLDPGVHAGSKVARLTFIASVGGFPFRVAKVTRTQPVKRHAQQHAA